MHPMISGSMARIDNTVNGDLADGAGRYDTANVRAYIEELEMELARQLPAAEFRRTLTECSHRANLTASKGDEGQPEATDQDAGASDYPDPNA